jgi:2-polyprenyl-3-methyl-5-hydroxy-6-metoxy-1,4-benzoquinol methylase
MIREKIILDLIEDKDVLDIGSVGQTNNYNLFQLYQTVGYKSLTGIDLPDAEQTVNSSFNLDYQTENRDISIVKGNMENHSFGKEFDVIIAGDVIEHVDNQGLFLKNILKHLREDGKLVITTPNAKALPVIFKPNPTHTLWHDKFTLRRILEISGFKIDKEKYYFGNKEHYPFYLRPLVYRQGLIIICSKK